MTNPGDTIGSTDAGNTDAVSRRLHQVCVRTGLSPQEVGVVRLYDRAHVDPDAHGPLRGLDVLVKDLNRVAGEVTTFGEPSHAVRSTSSDDAVQRLLDDGARLVGSSVTAEFGATVYTEPVTGRGPVNPIDASLTTGGSSSGAAVAVARGVVDVAHASDGGGSIRVPAAAVGLPGLKPRHAVFPDGGDAALPNPGAQGYIAADLELTARAYGVTDSPVPWRESVSRRATAGRPVRVGHSNLPFHSHEPVDPSVANATGAAAALLVTHPGVGGVAPVEPPYSVERFAVFSDVMAARCAGLPVPMTAMPTWLRACGRSLSAERVAEASAAVQALPEDVCAAWSAVDVVITPTLAFPPPPVGAFSRFSDPAVGRPEQDFAAQTAWTPWATLWNLTGWAGLSVPLIPAGAAGRGRWPVSVHLGAVSDRVSVAELLDLGAHLQDAVADLVATDPAALDVLAVAVPR